MLLLKIALIVFALKMVFVSHRPVVLGTILTVVLCAIDFTRAVPPNDIAIHGAIRFVCSVGVFWILDSVSLGLLWWLLAIVGTGVLLVVT